MAGSEISYVRCVICEKFVKKFLFLAGEGPFQGVIDMFGSSGGLTEYRSALLASRGFAALSLAYFKYRDLQDHLYDLRYEYFEVRKICKPLFCRVCFFLHFTLAAMVLDNFYSGMSIFRKFTEFGKFNLLRISFVNLLLTKASHFRCY